MIEYIIYIAIAFVVIHFLISVVLAVYQDDTTKDSPPLKQMAHVKVRMEQHNNCWYGYYHPSKGGEMKPLRTVESD
jgi:hypothetical protein